MRKASEVRVIDGNYTVPGRTCGRCTSCCVDLAIVEDGLNKASGVPCQYRAAGRGCTIYDTRPGVCRAYYCLWRSIPDLGDEWRPDKSGILMIPAEVPASFPGRLAVSLILIDKPDVLRKDATLAMIAGFIVNATATFLDLPSGPGLLHRVTLLNDVLGPAVQRGDFGTMRSKVWQAYRTLAAAESEPVGNPAFAA